MKYKQGTLSADVNANRSFSFTLQHTHTCGRTRAYSHAKVYRYICVITEKLDNVSRIARIVSLYLCMNSVCHVARVNEFHHDSLQHWRPRSGIKCGRAYPCVRRCKILIRGQRQSTRSMIYS
jgi:hypothetical protein